MLRTYLTDRCKSVLMFQILCIMSECLLHVEAIPKSRHTCQVAQEQTEDNQCRWVLPYEYPCQCAKIVYGGKNIHRPKRRFEPVCVGTPMVGDNIGEIRDYYGLNCIELTCPHSRSEYAYQEQTTRTVTWEVKEAVGNHGESLNVTCDPSSGTNVPIGQTDVTCKTRDWRGTHKVCLFTVNIMDFNECATNTHSCSASAACHNIDGSYHCTCTEGYHGNGFECDDIDECSSTPESHNCHSDATCSNTVGSYSCSCNEGYTGDGISCADIDECNSTPVNHNCHTDATCYNTDGSFSCSCNPGYIGDGVSCAEPQDCYEIYTYGNTTSGVYWISPVVSGSGSATRMQVWCDMDTDQGGWTVFQRRMDGSVDFYLDWNSYKKGFGDLSHEHWLGLDNIYAITNNGKTSQLRMDLRDGTEHEFAVYSLFSIGDEEDHYRLDLGAYHSGGAGDALTDGNGQAFSTRDVDNDQRIVGHCAVSYTGAWWYNSCHFANLNGRYLNGSYDDREPLASGIDYAKWKGYSYSLSGTEMKLRPVFYNESD